MAIVFLLLPALAADTLAAAAACAARGIRIPIRSRWIMALVSSSILFASMVGGAGIWQFFSDFTCKVFSFTVLFLLGIGSLFRSLVQNLLKKLKQGRVMQFHAMGLSFLLSICADETAADADGSKTLCGKEAAALALALSLDSLAAGFSGGFSLEQAVLAGILSFPLQLLVLGGGLLLGEKAIRRLPALLPELISGWLLILLAFLRL